jgi:hypothetical protein
MNVEICRDNDEFELISITCVVIDFTVIITFSIVAHGNIMSRILVTRQVIKGFSGLMN